FGHYRWICRRSATTRAATTSSSTSISTSDSPAPAASTRDTRQEGSVKGDYTHASAIETTATATTWRNGDLTTRAASTPTPTPARWLRGVRIEGHTISIGREQRAQFGIPLLLDPGSFRLIVRDRRRRGRVEPYLLGVEN